MGKPYLVCVDDEKILLESLRVELRREVGSEFQIETADSGEEALSLIKTLLYEGGELVIVISDENMPGMKGHELLTEVKKLSPETHTVLLTGYSDLDAIRSAVNQAGLYRYIDKPWRVEELGFTIRQARRNLLESRIIKEQKGTIRRLTNSMVYALEAANQNSDEDTAFHIERIAEYSAVIAAELGKDEVWVERLRMYSQLHDIGKVGVACQLLNSPDQFTEKEHEIMKQHVRFGWLILSNEGIDEMAANIAYYHHERWDGGGYLHGLKGKDIPLEARIVTVADVFDALSTHRAYKPGLPFDEAFDQIRELGGSFFDPEIAEAITPLREKFRTIREEINAREDLHRRLLPSPENSGNQK